jgi:hypothetical protein
MATHYQYEEIGRLYGDGKDIVISKVTEGQEVKGIIINQYINTERYEGWGKGSSGVIDKGYLAEFKELINGIQL